MTLRRRSLTLKPVSRNPEYAAHAALCAVLDRLTAAARRRGALQERWRLRQGEPTAQERLDYASDLDNADTAIAWAEMDALEAVKALRDGDFEEVRRIRSQGHSSAAQNGSHAGE